MYIIYNKINKLYWSNEWGWGSKKGCTKFSTNECNLPIDGIWRTI